MLKIHVVRGVELSLWMKRSGKPRTNSLPPAEAVWPYPAEMFGTKIAINIPDHFCVLDLLFYIKQQLIPLLFMVLEDNT